MKSYFTIFETDLGWMGIAWQSKQIRETQLPQRNKNILFLSMARLHQEKKAPLWIEKIIEKMQRHLQGSEEDFQDLPYFWDKVTDFQRKVYQGALQIPYGEVVSYKGLAEQIGKPKAARAVGQALSKNPFPLIIPCHRILASGNRPGGFTAYGGLNTKEKLLQVEGYSWGKSSEKKTNLWSEETSLLMKKDPLLASYMKKVGLCKIEKQIFPDTFTSLFRSIIYQQLTGKAAAKILARVIALFPEKKFPSAEDIKAISEEELRAAGMSWNKIKSAKDLAKKTIEKEIPSLKELEKMSDEAIIDCLTKVRGIGPWTVKMLLIFTLNRVDVFPADDYGVRKGFALVHGKEEIPTAKELAQYAEKKWKPYRSIATWYLWRVLEL